MEEEAMTISNAESVVSTSKLQATLLKDLVDQWQDHLTSSLRERQNASRSAAAGSPWGDWIDDRAEE
jgi:hypothetical protein